MSRRETDEAGGSVALVTGATGGIGEATARRLAAAGYRVIVAGRRHARAESVAAELETPAIGVQLDVASPASIDGLFARLPDEWRRIEVLVNNAGHDVGGRRPFHEGTADEWAAIIETNVTGLVRVTRAVIPTMIERDSGHVVNIGSIAGLKPYATGTLYAGSKHAVHGFSESLRLDYAGTGIRVTEILPGMVRTGFAEARSGDPQAARAFYDAFGECLEPDDVARAVLYALEQPLRVVISQLVVLPRGQP